MIIIIINISIIIFYKQGKGVPDLFKSWQHLTDTLRPLRDVDEALPSFSPDRDIDTALAQINRDLLEWVSLDG